jgi:hypothetical protein
VYSALAVPFFPFALLSGAGGNGQMRAESSDPEEIPKIMWRNPRSAAEPLFTLNGQRRAIVKLVAGLDCGASYRGDVFASGTVGIRLVNFFEFAVLARQLSLKEIGSQDARKDSPLLGLAAGLHIDGDGDPRFALYAGFEGTKSLQPNRASMVSLILGPRLGLMQGLFVGIVPLGLSYVCSAGESCSARFFSTVQIGGAI